MAGGRTTGGVTGGFGGVGGVGGVVVPDILVQAVAVVTADAVFVVDDSPDPSVAEELRELGARVQQQVEPGMAASRRQVIAWAADWLDMVREEGEICAVVWTEPEKDDIIRFLQVIVHLILEGECDIIIPQRSDESFVTYPKFQADEEKVATYVYNEVTGNPGDPMFGPVAFSLDAAVAFGDCAPAEYGVAEGYIQHAVPLILRKAGFRVGTTEPLDFRYPPEQKAEEDIGGHLFAKMVEKRLWQQGQLVEMYVSLAKQLKLGLFAS